LQLSNASKSYLADTADGNNKIQGKDTLSANSKTFSQTFDFYACASTFEKAVAHGTGEGQDFWNGHVTLSGSTTECLSYQSYGAAGEHYIQVEDCSFSDDSSQANQYWELLHAKNGEYQLSYRPSPSSSYQSKEFTFVPGTLEDPSVFVHVGSSTFSDYTFKM